jgi:hypothetical protein
VLTYNTLKTNRRKFLAMTGLTPKEFRLVLPAFVQAYQRHFPPTRTATGRKRQRQSGGGRKPVLATPEQQLLFALVYLKTYPLQVVLATMFEMSQPSANTWLHRLLPVLRDALDALGVLPERQPERFAVHERRHGKAPTLIIDGTERRRQRPKNKAIRDTYYSAHKKMHTVKNVVISNAKSKRIGFLSQTYPGRVQDKGVVNREAITYPPHARLYRDTGFPGYAPPGVVLYAPKKSRGNGR